MRRQAASMLDLARALGVSRATVPNALRGKRRLSPGASGADPGAGGGLRYIPAHAGAALRTGRSATIGLIVPDFGQPLFPIFAQAIERAAKSRRRRRAGRRQPGRGGGAGGGRSPTCSAAASMRW